MKKIDLCIGSQESGCQEIGCEEIVGWGDSISGVGEGCTDEYEGL